ncbi:MAG: hypothetical protein L6416_02660 [Candidatus Omnitrophica bacterium]|nr:hypothetical protein [Candidatus Omnitrophota bacterium]
MKKFFEKWKKFAITFANLQIELILYTIYFVLILPYRIGLTIKEIFSKKISRSSGCWVDLKEKKDTIDSLRRQY